MIRPNIRIDASVRGFLEALEDEILMHTISRGQFAANPGVYVRGHNGNSYASFLDEMLRSLEGAFSQYGRYKDPIERPFNIGLPPHQDNRTIDHPDIRLANYDSVSVTKYILEGYLEFVKRFCSHGDDLDQYGSTAEHDICVLMTVSQRVHSGIYVAEWKYLKEPEKFSDLAARGERGPLLEALTNAEVEKQVLERVRKKAQLMQANTNPKVRRVIDPGIIYGFYKDTVIPLTKEVEVRYFQNRI